MSEVFKVSGTRISLSASEKSGEFAWKFNRRPGGWWIAERKRPDGSSERHRFTIHESRGRLSASIEGTLLSGEVTSSRAGAATGGGSDSDLAAQFPGKVRKVLVQEGARVLAGEPLVLVEAMKMEFSVKAPYAGTVTRVLVQEGQQLSPGDRFVELKPDSAEGVSHAK